MFNRFFLLSLEIENESHSLIQEKKLRKYRSKKQQNKLI